MSAARIFKKEFVFVRSSIPRDYHDVGENIYMLFEISFNNLKFQYSGNMVGLYDGDKDIGVESNDYWKIAPGLRKVESLKDREKRVEKPIF